MSIRSALLSVLLASTLVSRTAAAQGGSAREAADLFARLADPLQTWEQAWTLELSRGGSAPLVWVDSLLLVASLDRNLHWVSVGGEEPRVEAKRNFKGGFHSAPVVTARRLLLPELEEGARLVAIDRSTREIEWTADAGDLVAAPVVEGSRIYTVSSLGDVRAWDENGIELWRTELETRVTARPALLGSTLLVASSDGRIHALDATDGTPREVVDPGAGPIWGDPVVLADGAEASAAVYATLGGQVLEVDGALTIVRQRSFPSRFFSGATRYGDRLYLAGHEGTVWSYDRMRDAIDWRLDLDDATVRMAPAVGDRYLAIGDLQGNLTIVDRLSGALEWTARLDGALTSTPAFQGDRVFALSEQGSLFAFHPTTP